MSLKQLRIAVVGGGIIGISSALYAVEQVPGIDITVIGAEFTPNTTGDGSAGFWNPYIFGAIPAEKMRSWCSDSFNYLQKIGCSAEGKRCGVGFLSCYQLSERPIEEPLYSDIFLEWRHMKSRELELFPKQYRYGAFFTTIFAECKKLLPYMMDRFKAKGGKIIQRRIHKLTELSELYDVVINCTGVEAAHLVGDREVQPIRGQVIRVRAPWIKHAVTAGNFYILPNSDDVVCGGTRQVGNWNKNVDPQDRENIWNGCCSLVPSLRHAEVITEWVGLRPGRSYPRIERETIRGYNGSTLEVIHNYGHGGSGVTLFWGCARDVFQLLQEIPQTAPDSKL